MHRTPQAETLSELTIINGEGCVLLQTIWLRSDRRRRRETEIVADSSALMRWLRELTPSLGAAAPPAAATATG
jgi:hypothetical protein